MQSNVIQAEHLGTADEVTVHGWAEGTSREVIIVSGLGQDVIVLSSTLLGDDFRATVERLAPTELRDAVMEWIEPAGPSG